MKKRKYTGINRLFRSDALLHAVILILASITIPEYFTFLREYGSIFVFLICFIIAFAIGVAKYAIVMMKEEDNA